MYSSKTPILVKKQSSCQHPSMLSKSTPKPCKNSTDFASKAICWGLFTSSFLDFSSKSNTSEAFPLRQAMMPEMSPIGPAPTTTIVTLHMRARSLSYVDLVTIKPHVTISVTRAVWSKDVPVRTWDSSISHWQVSQTLKNTSWQRLWSADSTEIWMEWGGGRSVPYYVSFVYVWNRRTAEWSECFKYGTQYDWACVIRLCMQYDWACGIRLSWCERHACTQRQN